RSIDDHPDVELFADVRALFDQQPPHLLPLWTCLVRDKLHAEDPTRVIADLVDRLRDLDAASLAAAARMNLRLDDLDAVSDGLRGLHRLIDRKSGNPARRRQTEAAKYFLALVFVDLHASLSARASGAASIPLRIVLAHGVGHRFECMTAVELERLVPTLLDFAPQSCEHLNG